MTANPASEYTIINDCTAAIKPLHEKYIGGESSRGIQRIQQLELDDTGNAKWFLDMFGDELKYNCTYCW